MKGRGRLKSSGGKAGGGVCSPPSADQPWPPHSCSVVSASHRYSPGSVFGPSLTLTPPYPELRAITPSSPPISSLCSPSTLAATTPQALFLACMVAQTPSLRLSSCIVLRDQAHDSYHEQLWGLCPASPALPPCTEQTPLSSPAWGPLEMGPALLSLPSVFPFLLLIRSDGPNL